MSSTDDSQQDSLDKEQKSKVATLKHHTDGDTPGSSATYRILEVRNLFESKLVLDLVYLEIEGTFFPII